VEDHGYVSRSAELTATFKGWGAGTIQEQDLLDALQLSIQQSSPAADDMTLGRSFLESAVFEAPSQLMVGLKTSKALSDPSTRVRWKRDARMAIYHNDGGREQVRNESRDNDAGLGSLLESAADDPGVLEEPENLKALTRAIGLKIHDLMLLPPEDLDTSASLAAIGVDSLIVMEILSWWKTTFKFSVGTLEFLNCATIGGVGRLAASGFQKEHLGRQAA
ncbi:acyl carrier protein, partial [Candidatus Bathyarchaeota archaeon]|nr:acyl carrier protein [Candidatus Bathyarchaeota archaeon]